MNYKKEKFGTTKTGETVFLYTLENQNGMKVIFSDYGAVITSLLVPDRNGKQADVVLGYENLQGYEENTPFFGAFVGRNANRIANAVVELAGKRYTLDQNEGIHNLHSGFMGYHKMVYQTSYIEEKDRIGIIFSRKSPHLEQGFPGNLELCVCYYLTNENALQIQYIAKTDRDTIVNFTNHSYFNLAGHTAGSVLQHKMWINSKQYTEVDANLIPTGVSVSVENTPMDFRKLKEIGRDIKKEDPSLQIAGGYDHNYVLQTTRGNIEKVAILEEENSGRKMEVWTDLPGLQVYTANFLQEQTNTKEQMQYQKYGAVCLETQFFPDACHQTAFASPVLPAGETFQSTTIYRFSCCE